MERCGNRVQLRAHASAAARHPIVALRNRVETTTGELTGHLGVAHHGPTISRGQLTHTSSPILAQTLWGWHNPDRRQAADS